MAYPGAEYVITEPDNAAPHVSVGALNPDNRTVALFSNIGTWVKTYAPGVFGAQHDTRIPGCGAGRDP